MNIRKEREQTFSFDNRSRYIESTEFRVENENVRDSIVIREIVDLSKKAEAGESEPAVSDYKKVETQDAWIDFGRFMSKGDIGASVRNFMNLMDTLLKDESTKAYILESDDEDERAEDLKEPGFPDYYEMILINKDIAYKLVLTTNW